MDEGKEVIVEQSDEDILSQISRRNTQRKNLLTFIGARSRMNTTIGVRSRINTTLTKTSDDWNQLVENITSSKLEIEDIEEK